MRESSGFKIRKYAVARRKTASAVNAGVPGAVWVFAEPAEGAILYFWEASADQKGWTTALETEHVRGTIQRLTSGQTYYFRYRAYVRGKGYTAYSTTLQVVVG